MPDVSFTPHMGVTFAVIVIALAFYALERVQLELTSFGVIAFFLVFFHLFPVPDESGANQLDAARILAGFANPALFAVVSLLVIGEGLVRTGLLDKVAETVFRAGGGGWGVLVLALAVVMVVSAFLNNIPVVVIFIPIMQTLADRLAKPASAVMMPLSFAAILGGMTTLIGSSTNLLVSGEMTAVGERPFGFFDFTVPGLVLACVGLVYVLMIAPRLLPVRRPAEEGTGSGGGRQFVAQLVVSAGAKLIGETPVAGRFPSLPMMTVRIIQRGDKAFLPPFDEVVVEPGDVLVVAAMRKALTEAITADPHLLGAGVRDTAEATPEGRRRQGGRLIAEAMVTPSSHLIGQTLEEALFHQTHRCQVLGIRRRSRMVRAKVTDILLEAGDILLLVGWPEDIAALRGDPDLVLMEWSTADLPSPYYATRAAVIFLAVVATSATGLLPIAVAALVGAGAMVATGVLTLHQADHAMDRRIMVMIGTALALGAALQDTGGADYLAHLLVTAVGDAGPATVLSAFFLLVALLSNVISTKACAVLFTPIAISIGHALGVEVTAFAVAVVFAANCSFASPIGYQTSLLVMTPGQYRFLDFARVGTPLIFVVWAVFSAFAPWYYGL